MEKKLKGLKSEIQHEKTSLMQRATTMATQIESLRRTVIATLAPPPPAQNAVATGTEPGTANARQKSKGRGANETAPSQEELEEIKRLMLSDELGPWSLVQEVRPPEWGSLIVATMGPAAFRSCARIEFTRLDDMNAALAASNSGSIVLGSSGHRLKLRTVPVRAAVVEESEAAQRGEGKRSGRLHDAELALDKTTQRLDAATRAMAELKQEEAALVRNPTSPIALRVSTRLSKS
jgi:hypothetical protein